ncbi:MAG: ABC transporter substrate-binding protein [Gammaproteobacteria bacterium]|nr:MAG: ABC transporter substrate-binding protein [Gammaproteobacteria bacterium]
MSETKQLQRLLSRGWISRREFVKRMTALGFAASVPAGVLASMPAADAPKKGGTLRVGLGHGSTTDSLDPATFENDFTAFAFAYGAHNHLTEILPDGSLGPELAESWEASPDARVWTFKLRKGVEFHNGKTLEASDVIASLNHHRGKDTKSGAKGIVSPIKEMKADGKHVLVITLDAGNADHPFVLSDYHLAIVPGNVDGKIDAKSGIGAGPYMVESYEPGVRAKLKRNTNYWRSEYGHFDEAEVLTIADVAARTNALTTGEVDAIDRLDIKTLNLLKRNKNISIKETSGTAHYTAAMRTDTPPFDNNDVRLALKLAVDRDALLQNVLRGHGVLGNDHPISRSHRYYAKEIPQRVYDPEKARFHLKKAGLSNLKVDLSAADAAFGGAVDAAVLMREHAAKAGIDINVVREPNDGYWSNVWMKKPWSMVYWSGRPTEDWMFSTAYAEGADWNDSFWSHERFNKLLLQARSELDEAKRREMYVEMQLIVRDEGGVLVPMFNNFVFAASTKVGHGKMGANSGMDGGRGMERWWFKS